MEAGREKAACLWKKGFQLIRPEFWERTESPFWQVVNKAWADSLLKRDSAVSNQKIILLDTLDKVTTTATAEAAREKAQTINVN